MAQNKKALSVSLMASDAREQSSTSALDGEVLGSLQRKVDLMLAQARRILELQKALEVITAEMNKLSKTEIPDLFKQLGLKELRLKNGLMVTVKEGFVGAITEANASEAFKWLEENGHAALIKNKVFVQVKKGDKETLREVLQDLELFGVDYSHKTEVHPQTLKAFINEQMEKGTNLPLKTFSIFPVTETKIKTIKK